MHSLQRSLMYQIHNLILSVLLYPSKLAKPRWHYQRICDKQWVVGLAGMHLVMWHIETETKWPPFSRRHSQLNFLEWKRMNFDEHFTECCSQRHQLTIFEHWFRYWLGAGHYLNPWWLVYWSIYASLGLIKVLLTFSCHIIKLDR